MILTDDQTAALDAIREFLFKTENRYFSLTGSAGTGKTTLVDEVKGIARVAVAAPTHKAKHVISQKTGITAAYTVAELIGLGVDDDISDFDPNKPQFKPKNEPKIQMHKTFVIDEASMINSELYNYITELADEYDTKVIFIGDVCQLPPVKEQTDSLALTEPEYKFELTSVVRQQPDNPLACLLLALRCDIIYRTHGEVPAKAVEAWKNAVNTFAPDMLETAQEQYEIGRLFGWTVRNFGEGYLTNENKGWVVTKDKEILETYIEQLVDMDTEFKAIAYTNSRVAEFNVFIRSLVYPRASSPILKGEKLMAYKSVKDITGKSLKIVNSMEYKVINVSGESLNFGNKRLDTFKCLLLDENGSSCFVNILSPASNEDFNALVSNAYFNAKKGGSWRDYYKIMENTIPMIDHAIAYNNQALPYKSIDYAYAITAHKSQGSTYNTVVVDGKNISMVKQYAKDLSPGDRDIMLLKLLYVAISRASEKAIIYF